MYADILLLSVLFACIGQKVAKGIQKPATCWENHLSLFFICVILFAFYSRWSIYVCFMVSEITTCTLLKTGAWCEHNFGKRMLHLKYSQHFNGKFDNYTLVPQDTLYDNCECAYMVSRPSKWMNLVFLGLTNKWFSYFYCQCIS